MDSNVGSIDKWRVLAHLDEELVSNTRVAHVFGPNGKDVMLVTKDDRVMFFGPSTSLSGLGANQSASLKPRSIETLSNKGIIKMAFGDTYVVALTLNGQVWTWGSYTYIQQTNPSIPTRVTNVLASKVVVDIASGAQHAIALTADGEVYAWSDYFGGPRKIDLLSSATEISCSVSSSLAVLKSGEVFTWSYNSASPIKLTNLDQIPIVKAVSGANHSLLLSQDGNIFAFGNNNWGQLGTGSISNSHQAPIKVSFKKTTFADIAAIRNNNLSAALSATGHVYIWGECGGIPISVPIVIPNITIDDIFADFGTPAVTFRPMKLKKVYSFGLQKSLSKAFNDSETSDLKIIVEGKPINVHKAILRVRCKHFLSMFDNNWVESNKSELQMSQYSYPVYYAFLRYLYTDEVSIAPEESIGLLDLANSYCENELKEKCERLLIDTIDVQNVAKIYDFALKMSAEKLENYSFGFAFHHLSNAVVTKAFDELDSKVYKDFMKKVAAKGGFKY